eukprot:Platyproteum_vivax@DN384_c0_g1_i2.p1
MIKRNNPSDIVTTLKERDYAKAVFYPPITGRADSHTDFPKMRLDDQYYQRAYLLCRGKGNSEERCRNIPIDTAITPQNPAESLFEKEAVDAIECMTEFGDVEKCYHYTDAFHQKLNNRTPEPANIVGKVMNIVHLFARDLTDWC